MQPHTFQESESDRISAEIAPFLNGRRADDVIEALTNSLAYVIALNSESRGALQESAADTCEFLTVATEHFYFQNDDEDFIREMAEFDQLHGV
jgi:hypothetical protein